MNSQYKKEAIGDFEETLRVLREAIELKKVLERKQAEKIDAILCYASQKQSCQKLFSQEEPPSTV